MVTGPAGKTRGHVLISNYKDVEESPSYFENGAFLSIGHIGCNLEVSSCSLLLLMLSEECIGNRFRRLYFIDFSKATNCFVIKISCTWY